MSPPRVAVTTLAMLGGALAAPSSQRLALLVPYWEAWVTLEEGLGLQGRVERGRGLGVGLLPETQIALIISQEMMKGRRDLFKHSVVYCLPPSKSLFKVVGRFLLVFCLRC